MNTHPPLTRPETDEPDDDVVVALRRLANAVPAEPVRDVADVRTRARRRTVRDRAAVAVVAAAAAITAVVVVGPLVQPDPQLEVTDSAPPVEVPDEPAETVPQEEVVPEASTNSLYPPASSEDGVTADELQAWYDLYVVDFEQDLPDVSVSDGVGYAVSLGIEVLTGTPDPRASDTLESQGEDAASLAEWVAQYRIDGTTPTADMPEPLLADSPEVVDLLRRLELTLRDEAGLPAPSPIPEGPSADGVTVDELRGWLTGANEVVPGVLDNGLREVLTLGIEGLTGAPDPDAATTLAEEGLEPADVARLAAEQREALPGSDADLVPEIDGLLARLEQSLEVRAAVPVDGVPQPVEDGLTPLDGPDGITVEELNAWVAAHRQSEGEPAVSDGAGRLFSMALEALMGVPDPLEPLHHLEANGLSEGADVEVADEIAAYRAEGADTFLADNPEVDDALRRTELTLREAAVS